MVMNCNGEVMDFDGGAMRFYEKHHVVVTLNKGCTLVVQKFMSTNEAAKRFSSWT